MIGGCYREGREDQFGALGLVLNALILWKTRYMDAAPTHLRSEGVEVKDEDVARLSPLGDKHINVQGRYHFTIMYAVLKGELRPLRDPDEMEELTRREIPCVRVPTPEMTISSLLDIKPFVSELGNLRGRV